MVVSLREQTRVLLQAHGVRPSRRLGQSFLVDPQVLGKILHFAELKSSDRVLEIGAGVGTLTVALAQVVREVVAIEVDAALCRLLAERFGDNPRVRLITADVLTMEWRELTGGERWKVVANIPYAITSPLIVSLLESARCFASLVLMVQHEVAERLTASPGTKDYGAITVFCQYYARIHRVARVSREAFYPRPAVDSALIRLHVRSTPAVRAADPGWFFRTVRAAFGQRRKVLPNALWHAGLTADRAVAAEACERAGVDPRRRGETLTVAEFAQLADALAAAEHC